MSDWSAWGACSASCGSASKTRVRSVITSAANNGTCVPLADTTVCTKAADNVGQCPYACLVSEFGDWGGCSKRNCGGGLRYRIRTITHAASASSDNLGHVGSCPEATNGRLLDYETCNDLACSSSEQARDCDMSEWGTWGLCSRQCGNGTRHRFRVIAADGGKAGAGQACSDIMQSQYCNTHACPIDCQVGDWKYVFEYRQFHRGNCDYGAAGCSTWTSHTSCDRWCGNGTRVAVRNITVEPQYGGAICPSLNRSEPCEVEPCPVDCVTSPWSAVGVCSQDCGGGVQTETRTVVVTPQHGGHDCPAMNQSQSCNTQPCNRNCVVSKWQSWSSCSETCDTGARTRNRTVVVDALEGGQLCPALTETGSCNTQGCPIDCVVGNWGNYRSCGEDCSQFRFRALTDPQNGGAACPPARAESRACGGGSCRR